MWIVSLALRRPHLVGVLCCLLLFISLFSAVQMRTDVLPTIDIPVALVVWNYPGLPAEEMEKRIVQPSERGYSMTVNGLSRIESRSIAGVGLLKLYFEPGANIGAAIAQISAVSSTAARNMPPGTFPPIVLPYNAGNIPVAQLTITGATRSEEELVEYAAIGVRVRLFAIPGLATPAPYGGKSRQINVDVVPAAVAARGMSVQEVVQAVVESNPNLPGATARLGRTAFDVTVNNNPESLDELRSVVMKYVNGSPVRLGDVADVYEGTEPQESIVRVNGRRATYLAIVRKASASTLAVVDATREMLPRLREIAPEGIEVDLDFDQSVFVRSAMTGVVWEAAIAALLVTVLIFVTIGSLRAVAIVATSIPLAVGAALAGLYACGETLNLMTLGGISLAIGMLVDDAIVEVENIDRNLQLGKPLLTAILDGAKEVAMPALASTLAVCVVFTPVALLTGPVRYLFVPLALAVVFAMLASYALSRTLVPTLASMLLRSQAFRRPSNESAFQRLQVKYRRVLRMFLQHRTFVLVCAGLVFAGLIVLAPIVGLDLFPEVDTGRMRLHVRAPIGTRLEETEHLLERVEQVIRREIPDDELDTVSNTIGLPTYYNIAFVQTDSIGPQDAELLVSLRVPHRPSRDYRRRLREVLAKEFPGTQFYFQSADLISQVLDFGASAPIDVQIEGRDLVKTMAVAQELRDGIRALPGTADVRVAQSLSHPALRVVVDRERAARVGLSQRDVSTTLMTSLNSSGMVSPSYWHNPESNVTYLVAVQAQARALRDLQDIGALPVTSAGRSGLGTVFRGEAPPRVADVASLRLARSSAIISHVNVQRVVNVMSNIEGRDLGGVTRDIQRLIDGTRLPPGVRIQLRGRSESLGAATRNLSLGLLVAAFFSYLLLVALFQSWSDPLIVMAAIPGALGGVVAALALTGATLNVESFMGAIMSLGIAVANSILLVAFANNVRREGGASALEAVVEAAGTRLRPVLITAGAMLLGMLPMAVAFGEGGEQNAPLGRAVVGGLLGATVTTLLIVPLVYAAVRDRHGRPVARGST